MEIRKAYLQMIKAYPGGWDAISAALGTYRGSLENRIFERRGQTLSVETALQLQEFSDTTLFAQAVASVSGGTFVKLPSVEHVGNDNLLVKSNELHAELGQLFQEFNDAIKNDGRIDDDEQKKLSHIGEDIHRTMEELLALMFRLYCRRTGTLNVPTRSE